MGRKVYISGDMSIDDKLLDVADHDPQAALMWPWLLTIFDDWGRAEANAKRIKASVFPGISSISYADVENAITLYQSVGLLFTYEVDGKRYMYIPIEKWYKYQTHMNRKDRRPGKDKMKSNYPDPPTMSLTSPMSPTHPHGDLWGVEGNPQNPIPSPSPSPSKDLSAVVASIDQSLHSEVAGNSSQIAAAADATDDTSLKTIQKALQKGGILAPSGFEIERLLYWHEEGIEMDAICYAIEKAALAGNRRVTYIEGILKGWSDSGITTKAQALEADHRFEMEKSTKRIQARSRGDPKKEPGMTPSIDEEKKKAFIRSLYV